MPSLSLTQLIKEIPTANIYVNCAASLGESLTGVTDSVAALPYIADLYGNAILASVFISRVICG